MAGASFLTDIRSMIDLAIGTPEVGVVDFCMLHTVLHCLAQQLHALDKPVELLGTISQFPPASKDVQTVAITEYIVETDTSTPMKPKGIKPPPPLIESTLLVVERVKRDSSPDRSSVSAVDRSTGLKARPDPPATGGRRSSGAKVASDVHEESLTEEGGEERVPKETRRKDSSEKLSLVTLSKFNLLENTVLDLKDRVYGSMPKNEQILEEVRSQTNMKAITDMWTNLNVSSRLEAAETGLAKLSSLVEDLIREGQKAGIPSAAPAAAAAAVAPGQPAPTTAPAPPPAATPGTAPATTPATGPGSAPATGPGSAPATGPGTAPATGPGTAPATGPGTAPATGPGTTPATGPGTAPATGPGTAPATAPATGPATAPVTSAAAAEKSYPPSSPAQAPAHIEQLQADNFNQFLPPYPWEHLAAELAHDRDITLHQLQRLRSDIDTLNKTFYDAMNSLQSSLVRSAQIARQSSGSTAALADRLAQLERRIKECCEDMGKNKGTTQDQMSNFQDQLDHLIRQMGALHEDFSSLKLSPTLAKDLEGLMELYRTVQDMQEQLRQVNQVATQLAGEKDDRKHHIKALLEQIEILKTIKMDREDMAEAMAEKADLRLLARKVSHDQFEMACDDLSRGLEHALGKLNTQEALWQQVLDDVQREIESKLDKMELSPLKEFFETKLRLLQDNLKQMASLRRNVEAAGTKRRLLRDVNCISCDAEAVMPLENTSTIPSKPLPAHLSMKPYLSYELDAIRKTQASNLPQRNLHDWETIEKQKPPRAPVKVRSDTDKHICNRYCGGSHTTTTPAQRVARVGHFIKQWGPDVVPLSTGLAAGDDGRLYKVTTTEHANVGPGGSVDPTCTKKQKSPEPPKPPPKAPAIIINKECRCMDAGP